MILLRLGQHAPELARGEEELADPLLLLEMTLAFVAGAERETEDAARVGLALTDLRHRVLQVLVDAGEDDCLLDGVAAARRRQLGLRLARSDPRGVLPEHAADLAVAEAGEACGAKAEQKRGRLLAVRIVRGVEDLLWRDLAEEIEEVDRAAGRGVERDSGMAAEV